MKYSILNPTGNITAIVTEHVQKKDYASVSADIMKKENLVEQVGFLSDGDGIYDGLLFMAGGEFCGNASMCAAAMTAMKRNAAPGDDMTVTLKVSGNKETVPVKLNTITPKSFACRVSMPKALDITYESFAEKENLSFPIIHMPGIAHAIIPEEFGIENAEKILPNLCKRLSADAVGVMLTDNELKKITPVVYVPKAGTLVREHSCASGTAAVGAYLAYKKGECISQSFKEPGGTLCVYTDDSNNLFIEGTVSLIKEDYI